MTTAPTIAPEPMPQSESDQGCEPATIVGVLVELKTEDCLIDWDTEVMLPTLPHPESSILSSSVPSSSLVHPSIMTVNYCFRSHLASLSPLLYKSQLVLQPSPASALLLRLSKRILHLRLQPLTPSLLLDPSNCCASLAPSSLGSTRLPRPSGFTSVSRHPACATDLRAFCCASAPLWLQRALPSLCIHLGP